MKKLLLISLVFISLSVYGQNIQKRTDTVQLDHQLIIASNGVLSMGYTFEGNVLEFMQDSDVFKIKGDTLKIIKGLLGLIKDSDKRYEELSNRNFKRQVELLQLVEAGIQFANNLPDCYYTKSNCAWLKYKTMLYKHGYSRKPLRKPKKLCYK